ncbi:hypothetical protein SAMN02746089_01183 [Caldanaerobius fijiensis DSM 17918]|uniref:Uncharacterized protein n=1 Tax=Caldanaerobius fijiensis DSM 17918 TaxID=1121256 RepID=A0A1M4YB98_9THEO|nr:hypothetical protein [Caldanaerobius fijiensis]SHF02772.1 hypothetical protein SAMN02746089_01183 [Caldanaerobius fijiensis DSM 17918]
MYKKFRKKFNNSFFNILFYQVIVCLFIMSCTLIINSVKIDPAQRAINVIKYWLSYKYDFINAYNDLKSVAPIFRQKVINTFEQIGEKSKGFKKIVIPVTLKHSEGYKVLYVHLKPAEFLNAGVNK